MSEVEKKYIVKNCPCNVTIEDMCDWEMTNETYCQDCSDCLIKQVIEKCKDAEEYYSWCICKNRETFNKYMDEGNMTWLMGRAHLATCILQLFEIEECE